MGRNRPISRPSASVTDANSNTTRSSTRQHATNLCNTRNNSRNRHSWTANNLGAQKTTIDSTKQPKPPPFLLVRLFRRVRGAEKAPHRRSDKSINQQPCIFPFSISPACAEPQQTLKRKDHPPEASFTAKAPLFEGTFLILQGFRAVIVIYFVVSFLKPEVSFLKRF
jgi:hypothetical protein